MIEFVCTSCGGKRSKRSKTGLCAPCSYAARKPAPRLCSQCFVPISKPKPGSLGLCLPCARQSPELVARRTAGIRKAFARPEHRAKMTRIVIENHARARQRPEFKQWLHEHGKRLQTILRTPEVIALTFSPEARAKRSSSLTNTRLAWCAPEFRDEYRRLLRSKRMHSSEARPIIEEQMRRKAEADAKRPRTFEEQLRAVSEGRATITVISPRVDSGPTMTLGGVSSGWAV